ncbi:MAG TPA: hypothetical protein VIG42_05525 [Solirubrobacteraceae bacterium]|jgi:hypothetical protein
MAVVGATSSGDDDGVALTQSRPLLITVDQDTTLVKDAIQEKRRLGLYPLQSGDIDAASGDAL